MLRFRQLLLALNLIKYSEACFTTTMATIDSIPLVDIDPSGRFKYVLIKAKSGSREKMFVRGFSWGSYHADIYEDFESKHRGLDLECLGGGRIEHSPESKKILVYGYSMGFGRADHSITVSLLKERYPSYSSITFSNEGY
ncbi:14 kDa phosphohistidine phosphatase [Holothuria leucospilota]|uniref:14 kDa phosphohistidine phosphatase n=1 Tax=Holothuria leucospilota TaxID=206669 RepID=A0A9Q1C5D2_HOLLE|nr:14 kDa phosphohistidine phosphatase [Holothuria leucospilota]